LNICTGGVYWTCALEGCIEQVYWADTLTYKYTPVYSLSDISEIEKKSNMSLLSERERKDTMLRLGNFRLWKTQGFRIRLVISCRISDSVVLIRTASARKLTEQLVNFYPLNITPCLSKFLCFVFNLDIRLLPYNI
jgi:hypothetical protein